MLLLRLTNGNCSPPCSGGSGSAKPCSGLRPLHGFAPPHFASPGLCFAKPLFGLAKRQLPRTLGEIRAKQDLNIFFPIDNFKL